MFRLFSKAPLRRLVHTSAHQSSSALRSRAGLAVGASAVTAYVAWKSLSAPAIALDSASSSKPAASKPKAANPEPVPSPQQSPAHDTHIDPSTPPEDASEAMGALAAEAEAESQEAGSGGAFNPVTGEINWDCPCLGGMAYGPCGLEFREAFSCFVFSEQEPKGIDCVEKFKAMQDCFRAHPEVYADEIMDDDEDVDTESQATPEPAPADSPLDPVSSDTSRASPSSREERAPNSAAAA